MNEDQAREYIERVRWGNNPICPHCSAGSATKLNGNATRPGVYKCKSCKGQFTVTTSTVFHGTHIPLRIILAAFYLVCSARKGISSKQLARDLGLSYKTAWYMALRIRCSLDSGDFMLSGIVEVDETYVGGKGRFSKKGRGTNKIPLVALVERKGRVKTELVGSVKRWELWNTIFDHVDKNAIIMTDDWPSYRGLKNYYKDHKIINHSQRQYVQGEVYTNTAECYFAVFKRAYHGTFHSISKRYLQKYCNEFNFRWNHRHKPMKEVLIIAIRMMKGEKITYKNRRKSL
jgi:transposase-like protein